MQLLTFFRVHVLLLHEACHVFPKLLLQLPDVVRRLGCMWRGHAHPLALRVQRAEAARQSDAGRHAPKHKLPQAAAHGTVIV